MIPICLITGFLGSGKTTLLQRLARQFDGGRIVFLVNEFSAEDIDGALVSQTHADTIIIPGGSIFCRCLVTEFIQSLKTLPERFGTAEAPVEGVVIEASGIANPKAAARMLRETRLDETYRLASILSVVDAGSFPVLIHTLPNITQQIEASDLVILNKTDLFSEDQLADVEEKIHAIAPRAAIERASYCEVELDPFLLRERQAMDGEYALCSDPHFVSAGLQLHEPLDLDRLTRAIEADADLIYRVKGFVPTHDGVVYLDYSKAGLTITPQSSFRAVFCPLAMIGSGDRAPAFKDLVRRIESGDFNAVRTPR